MTEKNHLPARIKEQLLSWQKKLPSRSLLTVPESHGVDFDRFQDPKSCFLPWRTKQTQRWNVSGVLTTSTQRNFGFFLSFSYRVTQEDKIGFLPTRWFSAQHLSADFILFDPLHSDSKSSVRSWTHAGLRGGFAAEEKIHLESDGWSFFSRDPENRSFGLAANSDDVSLRLDLNVKNLESIWRHGQSGFLERSSLANQNAFLASLPTLDVTGTLLREGRLDDVTGTAWLQHEKNTNPNSFHLEESASESLYVFFDNGDRAFFLSNPKDLFYASGELYSLSGKKEAWIQSDFKIIRAERRVVSRKKESSRELWSEIQIYPDQPHCINLKIKEKTAVPAIQLLRLPAFKLQKPRVTDFYMNFVEISGSKSGVGFLFIPTHALPSPL